MSEVKRYDVEMESWYLKDDAEGDFVRYKDYAELKAQRDALAGENAALKDYLKECSVVQGEGNWTSDAEKSAYFPAIDWMPTTPATDAWLKSRDEK